MTEMRSVEVSEEADGGSGLHTPVKNTICGGEWCVEPVGFIRSCFVDKNGTPRQGSLVPDSRGTLTIGKSAFNNPEHSLEGLESVSHIWVIFIFHQNAEFHHQKAKVAPPRCGGQRFGVFSTRSPHRPNSIGLSLVRLEKIRGATLYLSGLDLIDGTPVIDVKPYVPEYDVPYQSPHSEKSIVDDARFAACRLNAASSSVHFTPRALEKLSLFSHDATDEDYRLEFVGSPAEARAAIERVLLEEPRSVYRREKCCDKLYFFSFDKIHVTCWYDEDESMFEVVRVKPRKVVMESQE